MEFVYNLRNFELRDGLKEHFDKGLKGLNRALKIFGHFEKKGDILIDRLPRGQYMARVYLHLPKHHVEAVEVGQSPLKALELAANKAKNQVLKIKNGYSKFHNPNVVLFTRQS